MWITYYACTSVKDVQIKASAMSRNIYTKTTGHEWYQLADRASNTQNSQDVSPDSEDLYKYETTLPGHMLVLYKAGWP